MWEVKGVEEGLWVGGRFGVGKEWEVVGGESEVK